MKPRYTIQSLLLAQFCLAVGLALWYYISQSFQAAYVHNKQVALRSILVGVYTYCDLYGCLPPAVQKAEDGSPIHSWRFLVCRPYLGDVVQTSFYGQDASSAYSAPWNSPANHRYFVGPHRECMGSPASFIADPEQQTQFVAITGAGTAFDEDYCVRLGDLSANSILAIEYPSPNWHWMKPGGDLDVSTLPAHRTIRDALGSFKNGKFLVGFADGAVWELSQDAPVELLMKFFIVRDAKCHDRESLLKPFKVSSLP